MPIKVSCKCGQSFAAKDELAGKAVKCPKCGQPLRIPRPGRPAAPAAPAANTALSGLLDEVGIGVHVEDDRPSCPNCGEPLPANAILCVSCGLDLQTGKQKRGTLTAGGEAEELSGHGQAAAALMKKAERSIADDMLERFKGDKGGMSTWLIALLLLGIVSIMLAMSALPEGISHATSGWLLVLYCELGYLGFFIWVTVIAFSEGVGCGLAFLFVPFYWLYFIFTRWSSAGRPFLWMIYCNIMAQAGWGAFKWAEAFGLDRAMILKCGWTAAGLMLVVIAAFAVIVGGFAVMGLIFMGLCWTYNKFVGGPDSPKAVPQPDFGDSVNIVFGGWFMTNLTSMVSQMVLPFSPVIGLILTFTTIPLGPIYLGYTAKEMLPTSFAKGGILAILFSVVMIVPAIIIVVVAMTVGAAVIAAAPTLEAA